MTYVNVCLSAHAGRAARPSSLSLFLPPFLSPLSPAMQMHTPPTPMAGWGMHPPRAKMDIIQIIAAAALSHTENGEAEI